MSTELPTYKPLKKCLTPDDIERVIVTEDYHVFPGTTVTTCLLTLANGAKSLGVNYGAIDLDRQDWEKGKQEARKQAVEKVWELEGYLLRTALKSQDSVERYLRTMDPRTLTHPVTVEIVATKITDPLPSIDGQDQ